MWKPSRFSPCRADGSARLPAASTAPCWPGPSRRTLRRRGPPPWPPPASISRRHRPGTPTAREQPDDRLGIAVTDIRLTRPTSRLGEEEAFYDERARLPRIASFRDHDGYSGTIWRLGARSAQFEQCAGPEDLPAGAGWSLEVPGVPGPGPGDGAVTTDPEGYAWRVRAGETPPVGVRPTSRLRDCRAFYGDLLGLPVWIAPGGLTVTLPAERGLIRLEPAAEAPAPTVEDMLVFYFSDPDGIVIALAVGQ